MSPSRARFIAVGVGLALVVAAIGITIFVRPPQAPAPVLILFTLDTTRADALGGYGQEPSASPNVDALMARSIVYERAYSTAPFTGPSHASILTSQPPSAHGVIFNGNRVAATIASRFSTLPEHLRELGWDTAAIVSGFPLRAEFGFSRGFGTFADLWNRTAPGEKGADARLVVERAKAILAEPRQRPLFLWVHIFEPHLPYNWRRGAGKSLPFIARPVMSIAAASKTAPVALRQSYLVDLHEADDAVGAILAEIEARGRAASTYVALTADHGEYLSEHGLVDHSQLYEQVVHVPMAIAGPGIEPRRERTVVSTIDLAPTLLDLLGIAPMPTARGRSLVGLEPSAPDVPAFFEWRHYRIFHEAPTPGDFQVGVVLGNFKLVWDATAPGSPSLFDLEHDPAEATQAAVAFPDVYATLKNHLDRYMTELPDLRRNEVDIDPADVEMLRSLGYVQ